MADINKIGLLAIENGRILLCRKKRGSQLLILPGGKLEKDETSVECLKREAKEELGKVKVTNIQLVGNYRAVAAKNGGPPRNVRIELYSGKLEGKPVASSEIAELIWFSPDDDWERLSPSLKNKILPDLIARKILQEPTK